MLSDAHCHLDGSQSLALLQQEHTILTIINCDSPEEWKENRQLTASKTQALSYGIHPWKADSYTFEQVEPFLKKARIIGEIGLDNIWTNVPMTTQKKVFERQLAFAAINEKPVVLHTKGCEKEILSYIQAYPNHYLIHWYSSLDYQQDYIDLGCYFSIGLDLKKNPAVWQLAKAVPIDHLLIETDGLHAAEWALGDSFSEKDYVSLLEEQLKTIAEIKELSVEEVKKNTYQNLERFIRLGK